MGSKKGLTYILEQRYYPTISSIVPQLRYNCKLGWLKSRMGQYSDIICEVGKVKSSQNHLSDIILRLSIRSLKLSLCDLYLIAK
jgi:hypothetical protein